MADLQALTIVFVTGVTSFNVVMGTFYRVDTSVHNVTANLPPAGTTDSTDWCIIKNISGTNNVNVTPASGETMNGTVNAVNTLIGSNQSHNFMPGVPASMGTGWMSW